MKYDLMDILISILNVFVFHNPIAITAVTAAFLIGILMCIYGSKKSRTIFIYSLLALAAFSVIIGILGNSPDYLVFPIFVLPFLVIIFFMFFVYDLRRILIGRKYSSKALWITLSAAILIIGLFAAKGNIAEHFWRVIDKQLDRERSAEVGEDFNKISWGDLTFQINHHKTGDNLELCNPEAKEAYVLLDHVSSYKIAGEALYVRSKSGYAIIDEKNLCRIYMKTANSNLEESVMYDQFGIKIYSIQRVDQTNVEYLPAYDNFSLSERNVFDKMQE